MVTIVTTPQCKSLITSVTRSRPDVCIIALRKNEKTMGLEEKQRHSAALKSVTVNLAPANYEQAILSRWELPAVAKKSLIAVLDDYVGKEATRFDLH